MTSFLAFSIATHSAMVAAIVLVGASLRFALLLHQKKQLWPRAGCGPTASKP